MKLFYFLFFSLIINFGQYFGQTIYTLDSINSQGFNKTLFGYDQANRHILSQNHQFLATAGVFVLSDETSFTYDNNDRIVEQVYSNVQNNVLTPVVKTLINYNGQGEVSSITNLWYDVSAATYWNSNKTDYIRDGAGNVLEELYFSYSAMGWYLTGRVVYLYTNNLCTESLNQTTMDNGQTYENSSKQNYTYDVNGNPTEQLFSSWMNSAWEQMSKSTYSYDPSNNVNQILSYNMVGQMWDEYFKEDLSYNLTNDLTLYESFLKQGNNWNPQYKMINNYDTPLIQQLIVPNDFKYNSKIDIEEVYEPVGMVWSLVKTSFFHYSEENGTNSIASIGENQISIYPVPANDVLNIQVEGAEGSLMGIYNAFGVKIKEVNVIGGLNHLSVTDLAAGTYFLTNDLNQAAVRFTVVK